MSATLRTSTLICCLLLLTAPSAILDQVREFGQGGKLVALLRRFLHPSRTPRIQCRTSLCDRPAAVARSPTPPVEGAHHEARQKGILNPGGGEGTWGTTGGREQVWGPGLGSLLTMLPWFPRYPNLACTNEETPYGESPNAIRRESERHARARRDTLAHLTAGHTAETPRTRSHRQFPSHVPGLGCRGRSPEHEWEILFPS